MIKVAVPKEIAKEERRVAVTPETAKQMAAAGLTVSVEAGAGEAGLFSDEEYRAAGVEIVRDTRLLWKDADVVLKVERPMPHPSLGADEADLLKEGATVIAFLQPLLYPDLVAKLRAKKVNGLSMDAIPRIARAQKLDALSSQSMVAGFKAVLMAVNALDKITAMMMTAAGTIPPARVLVLGAGVAGLQAIATARRLGAVVEAFDTRPAVKEQVHSLGAKFLELDLGIREPEDALGYAKEITKEAHEKELEWITRHVKNADIIITSALVPGKRAPVLITEEAVRAMKPGSVIVDLAAEGGGNCALSEPGCDVVKHGVTILARRNVPSLMPHQASVLYARNVAGLLYEIWRKDGLNLDLENEIVKGALVTWKT